MATAIKTETGNRKQWHGAYQIFILSLCVYALAIRAIEVFANPGAESRRILNNADYVMCALFFLDFVVSFIRARSRTRYFFTWGWIDLLSSIPMIPDLRWGRLARVTRIFRVMRGVRATKNLTAFLIQRRAEGAFLSVVLIAVVVVVSSSILLLHFESAANSGIRTAGQALWWSVGTLTTVGYHEVGPVTDGGRLIEVLLMIAGIAIFGIFAGYTASWFLSPGERKQNTEMEEIQAELGALRKAVEALAEQNTRTHRS